MGAVCWGFVDVLGILGSLTLLETAAWDLEGLPGHYDMPARYRRIAVLGSHSCVPVVL